MIYRATIKIGKTGIAKINFMFLITNLQVAINLINQLDFYHDRIDRFDV